MELGGRLWRLALVCLGLVLVAVLLGRFFLFPNMTKLKALHAKCGLMRPGVTVAELTAAFGLPRIESKERYLFGTDEYSLLYSSYIVATLDERGNVVDLLCGEGIRAWPKVLSTIKPSPPTTKSPANP